MSNGRRCQKKRLSRSSYRHTLILVHFFDSPFMTQFINQRAGRSVRVFNGNLADAFKKLDSILGRNRVRAQVRMDERHEQKGAKRRRLSSERWRKRFAHEVSGFISMHVLFCLILLKVRLKVQLVKKIRRRGA